MVWVNYFVLILQMQEGHIGFMAKLIEYPLRPAWRQHLELLVVLITKSQGATQRRRRYHIIFRRMGVPCCRRTGSTILNTLLLGSIYWLCFYIQAH